MVRGSGNGGVAEHRQERGGVRVALVGPGLDDAELDGVGDHPVCLAVVLQV